ncbi:MAG: hypothetical protein HN793_14190 [Rhodospirillaceae bacterium]|nr:hypothetical protein [Rhodospirillaceae bacterium]MBT5564090.1 hypothetical protein [Rhodospirillaceae bacterium]MBT6089887.1 hypothetical protein [Rhodospirillaceae bacterium]MBT7451982.1 hypothetical protein [Rhodospirillaceae bacterium]
MNAAKILVWVMSGMLVALLAVLIVGLSLGWHKDDPTLASTGPLGQGFDLIDLEQPPGTVIDSVSTSAGELAITLSGGGLQPRVIIVDTASGAVRGKISLNASGMVESNP